MLEPLNTFCLPGPAVLGRRIAVIGSTCAGKTTLAKILVDSLHIKHIELDALHWGASWQPVPECELRKQVREAVSAQDWVSDGNYSKLRDIVWQRVDTFIWLDYDLSVVLWRWLKRTTKRVVTRERLWNNNRETFRNAFFSTDSLLFWILKRFHSRRREYKAVLNSADYNQITRVYLPNPRTTKRFCDVLLDITSSNE